MPKKIISINGSAGAPPLFWGRVVCEASEFTDNHRNDGWVETKSRAHLTQEQLAYLNEDQTHKPKGRVTA